MRILFFSLLCILNQTSIGYGQRWTEMDYGPYLTASIESSIPERNFAQKGLAIKLGPQKNAYVVFDTDLLRYSIGWQGAFLNFRGVAFDGSHGTWPSVAGTQLFGTRERPGWAHNGSFKDPRTVYEKRRFGPLPHDVARYQGLYLNKDRVILSYKINGVPVLDSPSWQQQNNIGIYSRTINLQPSSKPQTVAILDHSGMISMVDAKTFKLLKAKAPIHNTFVVPGNFNRYLATKNGNKKSQISSQGLIGHWTFDEGKGEKSSPAHGKKEVILQKARWTDGKTGSALSFSKGQHALVPQSDDIELSKDFSITAWVKTNENGTILSKTVEGKWAHHGKTFFIRGGKLHFDIGWVGVVRSSVKINDGQWHHVALTYRSKDGRVQLFVDGKQSGNGNLESVADPKNSLIRLGYTSTNFPRGGNNSLNGTIDEVRIYNRVLAPQEFGITTSPMIVGVRASSNQDGLTWQVSDDHQLQLHIPASTETTRIQINIGTLEATPNRESITKLNDALKATGEPENLQPLTKGGPPRWKQRLTTKGVISDDKDKPYVIDTFTPPRKNPWNSWMRFGGFDFFKDGKRVAICTWSGDVWIVTGIDTMKELTWQRIATGMYQPLGLKVINKDGKETIYVCCRDQITKLHDLNGDGEIDFYETFNNDHQVTEHFHEFAMDLQTDKAGNFYYAKSARHAKTPIVPHHGTLIKVSADGKHSTIICNGFRAANGVGIGPNGELMTSDQEGHWTPANRINMVVQNGFYGNLWSYHANKRTPEDGYAPPLCWLPKNVDRSPAEQLWVTSDKWGPLQGQMIHTSYGTGQVFAVLHERVNGVPQGGVVPIPTLKFPTGIMRGRFHPQNGQLYLCGLVGWSSNCALPGGFYRVRYTGKKLHLPIALNVKKNGIALTFTEPLDKETAEDIDSYALEQWNYRWTKNYGSKHYRVSNPKRIGQDEVEVLEATLSEDGKTVFLEIEDFEPVMQMKISLDLKSKEGKSIRHVIHHTINQIPRSN